MAVQMGSLEFTPFAGQRAIAVGDYVHRVELISRSPSPPASTTPSSGPRRVPLTRESPSPHPSTSSVGSTGSEDSEVLDESPALSSSTSVSTTESRVAKETDGAALPNGTPNGTLKEAVKYASEANGELKSNGARKPNGEPRANGKPRANGAAKEHTLSDPSDVDLEWPDLSSNRPPGLFNPSMACYSNATLQMLLHTPPLLNLVKAHDPRTCRCPARAALTAGQLASRNAFCMTCALRSVAQEHWSGKKKAYKPQAVQSNLGSGLPHRRRPNDQESRRASAPDVKKTRMSSSAS